jgi:hypothetical protein
MYIFAEPVSEEQILEIQTANKKKIEAFERDVLGLNKEEKPKRNDEVEETKEESDSEWEHIQAKVEQELQDDEKSSGEFVVSEAPAGALGGNSDGQVDFASWHEGQGELRAAASEQGDVGGDGKTKDQVRDSDGQETTSSGNGEERSNREDGYEGKVGHVESHEPEKILDGGGDVQPKSDFREPDSQTSKSSESPSAVFREEDPKKIEDSEDEADKVWLDEVAKEQQDVVQQSDDRDLLAMTLSIRNKVNGCYVLRPNNLTEQDSWIVEYSLAEVSSTSRAWSLYGACQTRRKKALETNDASHEDVAANYYLRTIRDLSRAGKAWRKKQDKIDSNMGKVVLGQSAPNR